VLILWSFHFVCKCSHVACASFVFLRWRSFVVPGIKAAPFSWYMWEAGSLPAKLLFPFRLDCMVFAMRKASHPYRIVTGVYDLCTRASQDLEAPGHFIAYTLRMTILTGMTGLSMGGVHASMSAALYPRPVACTPLLAPRRYTFLPGSQWISHRSSIKVKAPFLHIALTQKSGWGKYCGVEKRAAMAIWAH